MASCPRRIPLNSFVRIGPEHWRLELRVAFGDPGRYVRFKEVVEEIADSAERAMRIPCQQVPRPADSPSATISGVSTHPSVDGLPRSLSWSIREVAGPRCPAPGDRSWAMTVRAPRFRLLDVVHDDAPRLGRVDPLRPPAQAIRQKIPGPMRVRAADGSGSPWRSSSETSSGPMAFCRGLLRLGGHSPTTQLAPGEQ